MSPRPVLEPDCACGHDQVSHPRPGVVVAFVGSACMVKDAHGNGCPCDKYQTAPESSARSQTGTFEEQIRARTYWGGGL